MNSIPVSFFTKIEDHKYKITSPSTFNIPVFTSPIELSKIVNSLLELNSPPIWDFIIEGKLLTKSLNLFLEEFNISRELKIKIEYFKHISTPIFEYKMPYSDWISCVDYLEGFILTSCFDGSINLLNLNISNRNNTKFSLNNKSIIKVAKFYPKLSSKKKIIITAGNDNNVNLWEINNNSIKNIQKISNHTKSIESLAINMKGKEFASGSYDSTINVYKIMENTEKEIVEKVITFKEHKDNVSGLIWPNPIALYSGSWDKTIKYWDITSSTNITEWKCMDVIIDLDFSIDHNLGLTSHSNSYINCWDFRIKEDKAFINKPTIELKASSWVSRAKWAPFEKYPYCIITSEYNGQVKIWDIRSKSEVPVYTLKRLSDNKIFALGWWDIGKNKSIICTGGDGGELGIYNMS